MKVRKNHSPKVVVQSRRNSVDLDRKMQPLLFVVAKASSDGKNTHKHTVALSVFCKGRRLQCSWVIAVVDHVGYKKPTGCYVYV